MKKQLKHALATDCLFRPPFCNQTGYQTSSWFFWVKIELVPSALQKKRAWPKQELFSSKISVMRNLAFRILTYIKIRLNIKLNSN